MKCTTAPCICWPCQEPTDSTSPVQRGQICVGNQPSSPPSRREHAVRGLCKPQHIFPQAIISCFQLLPQMKQIFLDPGSIRTTNPLTFLATHKTLRRVCEQERSSVPSLHTKNASTAICTWGSSRMQMNLVVIIIAFLKHSNLFHFSAILQLME